MTRTKKMKTIALILSIASFFCMFAPMLIYTFAAFIGGAATIHKVALVSSVAITLILTALSLITKWAARCRIWIILLGLYFCLNNFLGIILTFAITQIIDELALSPLSKYYWEKYRINSEMDKRGA